MVQHNATPEATKAAVIADLDTGMSYFAAATRHGVSCHSAVRWYRETGRAKTPAGKFKPVDDVTRKRAESLLMQGLTHHAISKRLGISRPKLARVVDDMARKQQEAVG
jgi:transposase